MTIRDTGWDFNREDPSPISTATPTAVRVGVRSNWLDDAATDLDQLCPMDAIDKIVKSQQRAEQLLQDAVLLARATGQTWQAIAERLELTKQGAQQRFSS